MSRFVRAKQGLYHSVIYTDEDGKCFRFSGGTWTWRNHNPGNAQVGSVKSVVRRHRILGVAGGFAIFPDLETGHKALLDLLSITYKNSSIDSLVTKYAPKNENNTAAYARFLHKKTGVDDNRKIKDFTPEEFKKLWKAIQAMEGYKKGTITEIYDIVHVRENRYGIYAYCLKGIGWVSKKECIKLAKQGKVEAVVCTSPLGNLYLRSKPDNSTKDNFCHLTEKHTKEDN